MGQTACPPRFAFVFVLAGFYTPKSFPLLTLFLFLRPCLSTFFYLSIFFALRILIYSSISTTRSYLFISFCAPPLLIPSRLLPPQLIHFLQPLHLLLCLTNPNLFVSFHPYLSSLFYLFIFHPYLPTFFYFFFFPHQPEPRHQRSRRAQS